MYLFTQSVTWRNYQTNEANYPEILGAIQLRFLLKKKSFLQKQNFTKVYIVMCCTLAVIEPLSVD